MPVHNLRSLIEDQGNVTTITNKASMLPASSDSWCPGRIEITTGELMKSRRIVLRTSQDDEMNRTAGYVAFDIDEATAIALALLDAVRELRRKEDK